MEDILITTYDINEIKEICDLVEEFDDGKKKIAVFTKMDIQLSKFQNLVIYIKSLVQYEELVEKVKNVYLSPSLIMLDKEIFRRIVEIIINKNKTIVLAREIEKYCKDECDIQISTSLTYRFNADKKPEIIKDQLLEIRTPVLYITSFWEGLDKFLILLKTKNLFEKKGYKVLAFGSKRESEFIGIEALPEYLFQPFYDEKTKIIALNQLIEKRCDKENPDIVIISVPGEITKYSDETLGHMGIALWELKNAVFPDGMICSVPFEKYTEADAKNMKNFITQTSGIYCNYLHVTNKMINKMSSHRKQTLCYLKIANDDVNFVVNQNLEDMCNYHHNKYNICIDKIIEKFLQNSEIVIF